MQFDCISWYSSWRGFYFVKLKFLQTDLDFKGYYSLVCQDKCTVDFHTLCWKNLKEDEGVSNDKEFLGRGCLTPGFYYQIKITTLY